MKKILFGLVMAPLLSSCSQSLDSYRDNNPKLDLQAFFQGSLSAHGIVQDISGQVVRSFTAELVASWRGNQGLLDEKFYFNDGEIQYRCWRLTKDGDNYVGTAADVEGQAKGKVVGNVLNWQYYLNVETDSGVRKLYLDDWLYQIDQTTLINKTDMSFYGIDVAALTLSITKQPNQSYSTRDNCRFDA